MTTSEKEFEQGFTEYAAHTQRVDTQIDRLMPDYGITPSDLDTDVQDAFNEAFARIAISGLLSDRNKSATDDELYTMKRDVVIHLLARDHMTVDSPWIDLINDIVVAHRPVIFDTEMLAKLEVERQAAKEADEAIRQDITDYFANLTPEERLEIENGIEE